jgi:hypothetical protein
MTNPDPFPPFSDSFEEMFRRVFGPPPSRAQSTGGKPRKGPAPHPGDAPPRPDGDAPPGPDHQ